MNGKLAEAYVEIGANRNPLDLVLNGVRASISKLASTRFNIPGGGFAAMLGGAALVTGIGKAIGGASDLAETVSKVGATFGSQSDKVVKAADEMAASFGIPKREFLDAASQFGLIATGMGQSKEEAAALSVELAKLAADASSFYNVPVDVALEKIRAGLTGESEPLKAFGVIMDETTMKAEALKMGLGKTGGELTNQEKLVARVALIQKGLAVATGDLARTQDGASNQTRKFWGMLQNLGDTLGATVMPAVNSFLHLINAIGTDLTAAASTGSSAWSGFVTSVTGALDTVGVIYRNWSDIVERTSLSVAASFQGIIDRIGHLASTASSFLQWFATNWPKMINDALSASAKMFTNFSEMFTNPKAFAGKVIAGEIMKPGSGFGNAMGKGVEITTPAFKGPDFAPSMAGNMFEAMIKTIDERMTKREGDRANKQNGNGKPAGGVAAPEWAAGGAAKGSKLGVIDFESYNRELQNAALSTDAKMLDIQAKQLVELEAIKKAATQPRMGLGAAALFG